MMAFGAAGPYDKRRKRSRCLNCARRRVKCSNQVPCSSCRHASLVCLYQQAEQRVILIGDQPRLPKAVLSPSSLSKPDDATRSFQHFFNVFLPQNKFSGGATAWHGYLKSQVPQCHGHFSALAGIGALTVYTRGGSSEARRDSRMIELAIRSYQKSVEYLGDLLRSDRTSWNHLSMLSLAFLLSLFELMYDTSAAAWQAHMGFGTSVLLNIFGPLSFCCGRSLSIYREMRLFEISRSILFSEPTLLSQDGWVLHDEACRSLVHDWGFLETAFDLFLECSTLSQRATGHMDSHIQEDPDTDLMTVYDFTRKWEDMHSQLQAFAALLGVSTQTCDTIAAWMYYHTISLYLFGIFDGTLFGSCSAAQLSDMETTKHIEGILKRSNEVSQQNQVSHVFLLLPLRIAGNRCSNITQCREVMRRIDDLQSHFAIAGTVKNELLKEWSSRSLYA